MGADEAPKILYKCREVELAAVGKKFIVNIASEGERGKFSNPISAWNCFIDVLDGRVRRRIGDMLEQDGRNRYTGEKKEVKPNEE